MQTKSEEASKREAALLRKAIAEAESSAEQKEQATVAMEAQFEKEVKRAAAQADAFRHQLENAVRRRVNIFCRSF